jgi:FdhE protein
LDQFPTLSLPAPDEQARCRAQGMPLLNAQSWPRNPAWRGGLKTILQKMRDAELPLAACETVDSLMQTNATLLEEMADRILAGDLADISPQTLPFIAAALQVYWVHMASALRVDSKHRNHKNWWDRTRVTLSLLLTLCLSMAHGADQVQ